MSRASSVAGSILALFALACSACSSASSGAEESPPSSQAVKASKGALAQTFARVAADHRVPLELLVAVARVEGGLEMAPTRAIDVDDQVPAAGPLQLRHGKLDTLARGAFLMGTTEEALRRDRDLALEAGARVLAELLANTGADAADPRTWTSALEELSGYADDYHRRDYARRVLGVVAAGGSFPAHGGESITIVARPFDVELSVPAKSGVVLKGEADYGPADWFPTSCTGKCDLGRGGNSIGYIVIHDTEGGWDASVATLQNDPGKSVQYIVGEDGRVGQFVHESVTAWHAGNYWYNQRSIGIEHVGYTKGPFPEAEYDASAKLVAYLTAKYPVPKDRAHVIGHDQIPDGTVIAESAAPCSDSPKTCEASPDYGGSANHRDPGTWEWCQYMPRFGGTCKCNDVTAIWNCTSDKTKAYRCASGKVELVTCDGVGGCEVKPTGVDDVCHVAPKGDAGSSDGGDGGSSGDGGKDTGDAGATLDAAIGDGGGVDAGGEAGLEGDTDDHGGCSTGAHRSRGLGGAGVIALGSFALGLASRRLRARRR